MRNSRFFYTRIVLLFLFLSLAPLPAQDLGPRPPLPEGVRYKLPSAEAEARAIKRVQSILAGEGALDDPVLVGPFLAHKLGKTPSGEVIPATVVVPRLEGSLSARGWGLRGTDSLKALTGKLARSQGKVEIRRPTTNEMAYFWVIAPFDLEGSILVSKDSDRTILWNLPDGDGLTYLEEVSPAGKSLDGALQALAALPGTENEMDPPPNFVRRLLAGEKVPESIAGARKAKQPIIAFLTDENDVGARVAGDPLIAYVGGLKSSAHQFLRENKKNRIYIQFELRPAQAPLLHLESEPALTGPVRVALSTKLNALSAPKVRGPVYMFLLELP